MSELPSDEQLLARTNSLLLAAESISQQLKAQTEELARAIDTFDREILAPLRERGEQS